MSTPTHTAMNRHIPRRLELSHQKPDFLDHAGNAFYFTDRVERKQCQDFVTRCREQNPASIAFFWCLVSKGVIRVDTARDPEGQVLGVSETRTKAQPPQTNFEWHLQDNKHHAYSGAVLSTHYNRRHTIGLVAFHPFRHVVK